MKRSLLAALLFLPSLALGQPITPPGGAGKAENLRTDCADGQGIVASSGEMDCGAVGGGSSIILDLEDDEANESSGISEIATENGSGIASEPTADKLLLDFGPLLTEAEAADFKTGTDDDPSATVSCERLDSFFLDTNGVSASGNPQLWRCTATGIAGSATWKNTELWPESCNHSADEECSPLMTEPDPLGDKRTGLHWLFTAAGDAEVNASSAPLRWGCGVGGTGDKEPDITCGWYYNWLENSDDFNLQEHGFNNKMEWTYHPVAQSEPQVEWNMNLYRPDVKAYVDDCSGGAFDGTLNVGVTIRFDNDNDGNYDEDADTYDDVKGVIRELTGTHPTEQLTWTHVIGETVDNANLAHLSGDTSIFTGTDTTACLSSVPAQNQLADEFRPLGMDIKTVSMESGIFFDTNAADSVNTIRIDEGTYGPGMAINWTGALASALSVAQEFQGPVATYDLDHSGTNNLFSSYNLEVNPISTDFSGTNNSYNSVDVIVVKTPTDPGSGTTISNGITAIKVEDMRGLGSNDPAIELAAQTCSGSACTDGGDGNLVFFGGDWNDGHIVINNRHIWFDDSIEGSDDFGGAFRGRQGSPPSSGAAAVAGVIMTASDRDDDGHVLWGDADIATKDTGTEVCAAHGMTCVGAAELTGTEVACGTQATGSTSGWFYAFCK